MNTEEHINTHAAYGPILLCRCFAATLDYVVFVMLCVAYSRFFGGTGELGVGDGGIHMSMHSGPVPYAAIWTLYFPTIESMLGYTLGKNLFRLRVARENTTGQAYFDYLKRHLVDPFDFFLFGLIAILLVAFTREHKRIGDYWGRTRVEENPN